MRRVKCVLLFLLLSLNLLFAQTIRIKGVVISADDGESVIGASVFVKGTLMGVVTDLDGRFVLDVPDNTSKITISYVGMVTQEVSVKPDMKVILQPDTHNLGEVVIEAGIIQHDRVSFTGSYSMVTGEELKVVGNQNLIESLRSLDPSLMVLENNLHGSDPNQLANISLRGETSVLLTDVENQGLTTGQENLPLFILNGFETSLQRVTDLDINRIASITILKDAASTAIYGAKASNGVIVIETVKPKPGKIIVNYTNDSNISWADLGSYNMMNAAEKLEFERLAGKYSIHTSNEQYQKLDMQYKDIYNTYLTRVKKGIDTYWLKEPVRTAFTTKNGINLSGGSEELMFNAGASYKSQKGVMKESDRNTWEGYLHLTYRRNNINVTNEITISGTNGQDSPYAPFSNWENASPYFTMRNDKGEVDKYLERPTSSLEGYTPIIGDTYNPLYTALLESYSKEQILSIVNNLQFIWYIKPELRFSTAVSLNRKTSDKSGFKDPRHGDYDGMSYTEKGEYKNNNYSGWGFDVNAAINYRKTFNYVHGLTAIARAEVGEDSYKMKEFVAVGFPVGTHGVPSYANSYQKDARPYYLSMITRKANLLGVLNYAYDSRYLFDFTYRLDGSTKFGRNEIFNSFWSVGAGWNIHKEHFLNDVKWVDFLKLKATYGITGNQNINRMYSSSIYSYYNGNTPFGQGAYLYRFGNPNLKWQNTKKTDIGVDIELFNKRFMLKADVFREKADDYAVDLPQPPSSGITKYPTNLGNYTTKGVEFMVGFSPIYNLKEQIVWTIRVSGLSTKSEYGGMDEALQNLNVVEDATQYSSLRMYRDGYSKNDLWAVRSLGIDPATGNEVFLKKSGEKTFLYDPDDRIKIGSSNPNLYGTITTSFTYKRFMANVVLRYSFGGQKMNTSLFTKVENISKKNISYNQDKRALYDRWQEPGDIAQFRRIDDTNYNNPTYISSRFIQNDNFLTGESMSVSWDFSGYRWVKAIKVQNLRLNAYMNDIFRMSTIKTERSTEYPYAKTISFGISASL